MNLVADQQFNNESAQTAEIECDSQYSQKCVLYARTKIEYRFIQMKRQ